MQKKVGALWQAVEATGHAIMSLTQDGRILHATPRAIEWMNEYLGRLPGKSVRGDACPPEALKQWLRHQHALFRKQEDAPPARTPLVVERERRRLVVRHLCAGSQCFLLLGEQRISLEPRALEPLGLTPREAEVLAWVAEGKTNEDTGAILGIRPRTVEKHLENIYCKLGVETRTAAASRAFTFLGISA
jgi:DNA-binding CsgD family transcriptional regulator